MKLEYLDDISDGGKYQHVVTDQLIRLYDFDTVQATLFQQAIKYKLIEKSEPLILNNLEFIEAINCTLTLKIAGEGKGIEKRSNNNFVCLLTKDDYNEMVNLIEPYLTRLSGYQWLYDKDNGIDFLFSPGGSW